jgi:hypothetical protein
MRTTETRMRTTETRMRTAEKGWRETKIHKSVFRRNEKGF